MSKLKPTDEQDAIVSAALSGRSLKVEAYAGAGKTSTLKLVGEAMTSRPDDKRILYLAFNKALADEAQRKIGVLGIECRTAHSLAFRNSSKDIRNRLSPNSMEIRDGYLRMIEKDARLGSLYSKASGAMVYAHASEGVDVTGDAGRRHMIGALRDSIAAFEHSCDASLSADHVSRGNYKLLSLMKFSLVKGNAFLRTPPNRREAKANEYLAKEFVAPIRELAESLWRESVRPGSPLKITHDTYLKLFQMSNPILPYDTIFVDEAQDLDPVMLDIIRNGGKDSQTIFVGDSHQQIYGWRGATNAMALPGLPSLYLTQSFRFGDDDVADYANWVLDIKRATDKQFADMPRLRGNPALSTKIENVDDATMIINRSNAGVLQSAIDVISAGGVPYLAGGTKKFTEYLNAAYDIRCGRASKHSDFLAFGDNYEALQEFAETADGRDYKIVVNLVEKYGDKTPGISNMIASQTASDPSLATVYISTVHGVKGLESPNVRIGDDFSKATSKDKDSEDVSFNPEVVNICYVALTRAQKSLSPGSLHAAMEETRLDLEMPSRFVLSRERELREEEEPESVCLAP